MINICKTLKSRYWSHVSTAIINEAWSKAFCYNPGHNILRLFDV